MSPSRLSDLPAAMLSSSVETQVSRLAEYFLGDKQVTVLTGAGVSSASGIPTFRGPEGYWTVGSRAYMPEEMATLAMFRRNPGEVWKWYLYRLGVCLTASPNAAHMALVAMERHLQDRFGLVTQNVDNLHLRAGSSAQRTFQIHGNISFTRCSLPCHDSLEPIPRELLAPRDSPELTGSETALLQCPECGHWLRPHVLWFDESYDERYFKFDSSITLARRTDLLLIAGTSGATTLPNHIAEIVLEKGGVIVDINPEENSFSRITRASRDGDWIQAPAEQVLPAIARRYCGMSPV